MVSSSSESPREPKKAKKGKAKTQQKEKQSVLKQKSPAEFFAENKNIVGFDNPGKSLYTTVRELVENSLDSSESISELPVIDVTIQLAKGARDQEIWEKNTASGKKLKETQAFKSTKGRGDTSFFKATCKDNGKGMPHEDIANMLGRGFLPSN